MDEQIRADIRKKAKVRFQRTLLGLMVLAVFLIFVAWSRNDLANGYRDLTLRSKASQVGNEFLRFCADRSREIALYEPPDQLDQRATWADSLQADLDQPAAILTMARGNVTWLKKPAEFEQVAGDIEKSFAVSDTNGRQGIGSSFGSFEILSRGYAVDGINYVLYAARRSGEELRWGAVIKADDLWPAFFKDIERAGENPQVGTAAYGLQNEVRLRSDPGQDIYSSLRVLEKGKIVYASPGLDTTRWKYVSERGDHREEYYLGSLDSLYAQWIGFSWWLWLICLMPFVLLLPVYGYYRYVMTLTEPEKP